MMAFFKESFMMDQADSNFHCSSTYDILSLPPVYFKQGKKPVMLSFAKPTFR
jgi:hypothetical protein